MTSSIIITTCELGSFNHRLGIEVLKEYAKRHGYEFDYSAANEDDRTKLRRSLTALEEYSVVCWLSSDFFLLNQDFRIETILEQSEDKEAVIFLTETDEGKSFKTFIAKSNHQSRDIFRTLLLLEEDASRSFRILERNFRKLKSLVGVIPPQIISHARYSSCGTFGHHLTL